MNEQELRERISVVTEQFVASRSQELFGASTIEVRLAGEMVYGGAFGLIGDGAATVPTSTTTAFDLDGLTELFTATAFLRLVDTGRLWIDTPLNVVLPDAAEGVTFYHLLTHTSGLPATIDLCDLEDYEARIMAIEFTKRIFEPGTTLAYSPLNFMLLGLAIETLTDLPLEQAIALLVLQPLDLHAGFAPLPRGIAVAPTSPKTHGEPYDANARCLDGIAGHAGLFGTAADMAMLAGVYLDGGHIGGVHFLSRAVAEEATRPHQGHMGFGWHLTGVTWTHSAKTGVVVTVDPLRRLTLAWLTNAVWDGDPRLEKRLSDANHELVESIQRLVDAVS